MSLKYEVSITDRLSFNRHGNTHRVGGPASIWKDGDMFWYQYGRSHRDDGPADVFNNGRRVYYFRGLRYTQDIYESKIRSN